MVMFLKCSFFLILIYCKSIVSEKILTKKDVENTISTDIAHERDERLLLFATLDGRLTAIEQETGKVRWKIKENPIVQVPLDTTNAIVPIFLPDPRDGSLYLLGNSREPLKKLPFTIPQLVSSSPCRSSDGILYTGQKTDTWFKLDPVTGKRQQILGWDDHSSTCPVDTKRSIYIGRTKYNLKMVDIKKPENKWNVTFYDYTATPMDKEELGSYDLVHFTSTSSGRMVTLDRRRGNLLWDGDLGSPIIRTYLLDPEGLIAVPFTSMANHTISYLVTQLLMHNGLLQNPNQMKLYPTLYIGEHIYGLYATPSLVDQNVVTITASDAGPLLLGGPYAPDKPKIYSEYPLPGHNYRLPNDFYNEDFLNFQSLPSFGKYIFSGHYNIPQFSDQKLIGIAKGLKLITDESTPTQNINFDAIKKPNLKFGKRSVGVQTNFEKTVMNNKILHREHSARSWIHNWYRIIRSWINQQENKGLKLALIILTGCVIAMFWYLQIQAREVYNLSQTNSSSKQGLYSQITSFSEELPNGLMRIGKISFYPEQLLGKGCEGTLVYRGEFDNRQVAVKRLLPECFTFADREVALLRESDAHPHVVRYYCMEQDRMFKYIALELCQATLSDYVQGKCDTSSIKPLDILKQATLGLSHLHSLDIVHRDIKPHNVLISIPNNRGEVRAMISDFGLCKKLQVGKVSFSRRSGITGTDGWIAPEMLNGSKRTTYAVDLFSLGCLYYYVLSNGFHPFGDSLRRQANILKGDYSLSKLNSADWEINLQKPLLSALISAEPENRPSCEAILQHPMFWSFSKILSFFQDVSDRIEKAKSNDIVLLTLENNSEKIVKTDWRLHIHEEVASDLRKYRSYHGESVRDLLRALRNKKNHFQELSEEAQKHLGELPEAFANYWNTRFPLLLAHTWISMQYAANESTFKNYYHGTHRYSVECFQEQIHISKHRKTLSSDTVHLRNNEISNLKRSVEYNGKVSLKPYLRKVSGKQNERNVKYGLIQSGGLYRNLISPEQSFSKKQIKAGIGFSKRTTKGFKGGNKLKKSEEPSTWVLNNEL